MNNEPDGKPIENLALRTEICLLIYIEKARKFAEKPHCVDFCVLDSQLAKPE